MKTIILVFLLSVMAFGQSGKSNLTQQQKDSIGAIISDSLANYSTYSPNADILEVGSDRDYTTIESALAVASGKEIVWIANGTYDLSTFTDTITTPLKIIGQHRDSVIINFDKSDRTVGFNITNSLHLENLTIKSGARAIKIPANLGKEIDYFIIRNVTFDDIVEKCVVGVRTTPFASVTRIKYGEISNCKIINSDGGFRLENLFKDFKAFNNYFYNIQDTIAEPKSVGYNNGISCFYIGNADLYTTSDSGMYQFYNNTFNYLRADLRQPIQGVNTSLETFYVPDNTIDSNDIVLIRRETLDDTIPSPLSVGVEYRVVYSHNDTIKISLTSGGSPINIATEGVGSFNFFTISENHPILCYGNEVSIRDNIIEDMVTQYKYDSEVFYVKSRRSAEITDNIIVNAGTGDGVIALKTGGLPEQSSISGNFIYKNNGDYEGDAIYTTTYSKVDNNSIIFRGNATGTGTAGGVYFNTSYEYYSRPMMVTNNVFIIENEDYAISVRSECEGDAIIIGNHVELKNNASFFYISTSHAWGVVADSLFLTHIKISDNFVKAKGSSRVWVRYFTGGMDYTNNTVVLDSITSYHIVVEASTKGYINLSGNTLKLNSATTSSGIGLLQVTSAPYVEVIANNNKWFFDDNIEYCMLLSDGGITKSLRFENNEFYRTDLSQASMVGVLGIWGEITKDAIIQNNIIAQSDTMNMLGFLYLRTADFGGDLILKNNKVEQQADAFISYRLDNTIAGSLIIENNIIDTDAFYYNFGGAATLPVSGDSIIVRNYGYITSNSDTVVTTNDNSVTDSIITVTHGLDITPTVDNISVNLISSLGSASYFYLLTSDITSTVFKIRLNTDAGQVVRFNWQIKD